MKIYAVMVVEEAKTGNSATKSAFATGLSAVVSGQAQS